MLKTLASFIRWPLYDRHLHRIVTRQAPLFTRKSVLLKSPIFSKCQYSTSPWFAEEETLSHKVLEHFRENAVYSTSPGAFKESTLAVGGLDEKYAIKQMLLVIAHSSEVKVDDVLQLFSLYSSQRFLMQSIISDASLMERIFYKVTQSLHYMKPSELKQFVLLLKKLKSHEIRFLRGIYNDICSQCEQKARKADLPQALELFDILLLMEGNNIYRRREYEPFVSLFENKLDSAKPHELVQILHYIGLGKRNILSREVINKVIKKLEPHLNALPFSDAGIAAAAIFKAGVGLDKSSLMVLWTVQHLKDKMESTSSLNDIEYYSLISMIKLLRISRCEDRQLLSSLSKFILKADDSSFNLAVIPHFLAFYANSQFYEAEVFSKLENLALEHLSHPAHITRIKDISNLLWYFGHTGHQCSSQFHSQIEKSLMACAHQSEVGKRGHFLIDALLSLAMSGHYPEDLIKKAFTPSTITEIRGQQRSKQLSRLVILYECLQVEAPEITVEKPRAFQKDLPKRTLSNEIFHRPRLAKLMEGVKFIHEIIGVEVFKLRFMLPSINYANLVLDFRQLETLSPMTSAEPTDEQSHVIQQLLSVKEITQNHRIAIEVFESHFLIEPLSQPIEPLSQPIGLIRLKLRLLQNIGWNIKFLSCADIDQCEDDTRAIAALLIDSVRRCD